MLKLQILGIGCRRSLALKANVLEALKAYPLPMVSVEEITEVEQLMQFDISAVPALIVNGHVVAQDSVPTIEEIKQTLIRLAQTPAKPIPLKRILVPTDFSETARGAFRYAQELGAQFDSVVKVVHVYHPEFDAANPFLSEPLVSFDEVKRNLLQQFVEDNRIESGSPLQIEWEVVIGFAAEEIAKLTRSGEYDAVVMGTTGESGFLEKIFGSVSTYVAQHAFCPAFFVPRKAKFRQIRQILYASKYQPGDEQVIQQVVEFARATSADVHFVHVQDGEGYKVSKTVFEQIFRDRLPDSTFNLVQVESSSIEEGLSKYAADHAIDLVVLGTVHRNLFERLTHRSVTKRMLINAKMPLMVAHFD